MAPRIIKKAILKTIFSNQRFADEPGLAPHQKFEASFDRRCEFIRLTAPHVEPINAPREEKSHPTFFSILGPGLINQTRCR
jgi:hypothetical protein